MDYKNDMAPDSLDSLSFFEQFGRVTVAVLRFFLITSFLLGVGLMILFGGTLLFWNNQALTLPLMYVLDVPVGAMQQDLVQSKLEEQWRGQDLVLHTAEQSVVTELDSLGVVFDAEATAEAAVAQTTEANLTTLIDYWTGCRCTYPVWELDTERMTAYLQTIEPELTEPVRDASVAFIDGRLQSISAQSGTAIDIPATIEYLQANGSLVVAAGRLPVTLRLVEPAITSTAELVAAANEKLDTELTLPLFDPVLGERSAVLIPAETWGGWLALQKGEQAGLAWLVDKARVSQYVSEQISFGDHRYIDVDTAVSQIQRVVEAQLAGESADVTPSRVYHGPRLHTVQAGDTFAQIGRAYGVPYPWLQQANEGVDGLAIGQAITIPSIDEFLPLPIVDNKRLIVSISEQTMWAYENDQLLWEWTISTGIEESPTWPGVYQVRSHEENAYAGNWDLWMPNFMGIYQPVPTSEFMNGFHGFPTRNGSNLLWTNSLGTPVTYGCVLVGNEQMTQLYNWAEEGTVVEIRP